jgi:hypothetical protein
MKRHVLAPLAVALFAVLIPAAALAKGASEAEIVGPGLDDPITMAGEGQLGGETLMRLAEAAGFFPAVFPTSPDPMLDQRPKGDLGPRYTVTYVMPGPSSETDELRQDVYPYAKPSPVTYVEPGQPFFGTEKTRGGWFVATTDLKNRLVSAGLPQSPPTGGGGSELPWTAIGLLAAITVVLVLAAGATMRLRRRAGPATV